MALDDARVAPVSADLALASAPPAQPSLLRRRLSVHPAVPALVTFVLAYLLWALVVAVWAPNAPGPTEVLQTTVSLLISGELTEVVARTALFMGVGFACSAVVGTSLGLVLGRHTLLDQGLSPYLIGLQSLPSAIWIPFAVLILGISTEAVLAVTIIGAIPSIAIGTRNAVHSVPPLLMRAAETLGESGFSLVRRVVLPASLPGILSGLELGWAFAFRSLVAAELITGTIGGTGIGVFLNDAKAIGAVDRMLAAVLSILFLGLVVDRLIFARIGRALRHRRGLAIAS